MEERIKELENKVLRLYANEQILSDTLNKTLEIMKSMSEKMEEMGKEIRDLQHTVYKTPW